MARKKPSNRGLLLVPILLVLALGIGWKIYGEWQRSKLGEGQRYNIVVSSEKDELVKLVSLDKFDKTITTIEFPKDLYVETAFEYGKYSLDKVWAVGELDKRGGAVLAATVEDLTGVPVDGYIRVREFGEARDVREIVKTDLSVFDLARVAWEGIKIRADKIKTIDLGNLGAIDDLLLADGSKVKSVDTLRLDYFLQGEFLERNLREENLKAEVLNAKGKAGLGTLAARMLETVGIDVVNVGNSDLAINRCEVLAAKKDERSLTVKRIAKIFGCTISPKEEGRADITLLLRVLHPGE